MNEVTGQLNQTEIRIHDLEHTTGFAIHELPFSEWRAHALSMKQEYELDWPRVISSGYVSDHPVYTPYAADCRSGVAFKKKGEFYVPNIFHFDHDVTTEEINESLEIDSKDVFGFFGTVVDKPSDTTEYLKKLGFIPLIRTLPHRFNVLANPLTNTAAFSFASSEEMMKALQSRIQS
jgi:hypothetical protein